MARPVVLDTAELIDALRHPERIPALMGAYRFRRLWLTSVTVAELYAGTRSAREARVLDRIVDTFARADHLVTPTPDEWRRAGQLIARCIRLHGSVEPRDHLADVLIDLIAGRIGGTVVTANVGHFERCGRLARQTGLDVTVTSSRAFT